VSQKNVEFVEFVEGLFAGQTAIDKQELLAALPRLVLEICDPEIEWIESSGGVGCAGGLDGWPSFSPRSAVSG
jgi:hypothetical protein